MPQLIKIFEHKDQIFAQFLFSEKDDRVEIQDDNNNVLVTFSACCEIKLGKNIIGRIRRDDGENLMFYLGDNYEKLIDTGVSYRKVECYFEAERFITIRLAEMAEEKKITIPELATYFSKVK